MDVRLPDGRIVKNVPEGTTKAQLIDKLRNNGIDVSGLEAVAAPAEVTGGVEFLSRPEGVAGIGEIPRGGFGETKTGKTLGYLAETAGNIPESAAGQLGALVDVADLFANPEARANLAAALPSVPQAVHKGIMRAVTNPGQAAQEFADYIRKDPVGAAMAVSGVTGIGGALSGSNRLRQIAAATDPLRAVVPLAQAPFSAGAVGYEFARNMMAPRYATYLEAVEGKGPQVAQMLRGSTQLVPGSVPTAAEAAAPLGLARLSQLGASAESVMPTAYTARAEEQAAARLAAMRSVGKTEQELKAAKEARSQEAGALYKAAEKQVPVTETPEFTELLSRPSMDKALARAAELSAERGQIFQIGETAPAKQVASGLLGPGGETLTREIPATKAKYPIQSLHNLKLAMDDLIRNPERFGIGASEAAAIAKTRGEFLGFLKQKSPLYEAARAKFAEKSGPINRMEIGQYLESKLLSPLDETAPQRAGVFATAVEQAPTTIKRSIEGAPRYENLSDVLTPDEVRKVENIRADLARAARADRLARAGAQAGPEAGQAIKIPRANLMSRVFNVVNRVTTALERTIDKRIALQIATEMLDPQQTAQVIEDAVAYAEKTKKTGEKISGAGKPITRAIKKASPEIAAIVTLQNALAESKNKNAMARQ